MAVQGVLSFTPSSAALAPQGTAAAPRRGLPISASSDAVSIQYRPGHVEEAAANRLADSLAGLGQAKRNADQAASLAGIADDALEDIAAKLTRMKTLATEASAATSSAGERAILNDEFVRLRDEIDQIANATRFRDLDLLKGGAATDELTLSINVGGGAGAQDAVDVALQGATAAKLDADLPTAEIATSSGATAALADVQSAIDTVNQGRAKLDGAETRINTGATNADTRSVVDGRERDDLVAQKVTVDFNRVGVEHALDQRGIVPELQAELTLQRALAVFEAAGLQRPFEPAAPDTAQDADQGTAAPNRTEAKSDNSTPRPAKESPGARVDILA